MFKKTLNYLRFLCKSTNQHGVHSPFVYYFLTEGIYNSKKIYKGYSKKNRLLQATLNHFQVKEVLGNLEFQNRQNKEKAKHLNKETYTSLHYIETLETHSPEQIMQLIETISDETILYINRPHISTKANKNWCTLKENMKFHVSIDFYIAGILFTRKEQRKEHFRLRV